MAKAPVVRDLQALIKEQSKAIAPQNQLINESINQNESAGLAQQQGLAAQQKQAFGNIEQTAQNKGMFFSGFSPDEQATYTSTTYLPALAALQGTIAKTRADLLGKKADLATSVFDKATNMREQDRATLAAWNKMTAEQQFNASEAEKQRVWEAQQNQIKIAADARNAAMSAPKDNSGIVRQIAATMEAKKGRDGKVSPSTFQQQRSAWVAAGGDADSFNQTFFGYVNTGQQNKYL